MSGVALEECLVGGEKDGTAVCAADGEELGFVAACFAETSFDVETPSVEVLVSEAIYRSEALLVLLGGRRCGGGEFAS